METNNLKIGILGHGEIGKAIASFYDRGFVDYTPPELEDGEGPAVKVEVEIQDILGPSFSPASVFDVVHVCIPFKESNQFVYAVDNVLKSHGKGALVFIHSTVEVGTTNKLHTLGYKFVVHAPVRGLHPNLAEGIKTFPMFVGADFAGAGRKAGEHLEAMGIEPIILYKSETSELLKLLDTTYYGICIAYHAYAKTLCEKHSVNFDMVMGEANRTYNDGYTKLGKKNVVRPVLHAPQGPIGGHCVVPNAELLERQFGTDPILQAILRHK